MPLDHWRPDHLTKRHKQALLSMARGEMVKTTADTLGVSFKTAGHHRQGVYYFFKVHNSASAVVAALKTGHLKLEEI